MRTGQDARRELGEFLATRRARITPQQAGLPNYGGRRRVPGLRREEVALLAGISIEYYTRIERGSVRGVSDDVLDALARALQLDDVERAHLLDLVRTASTSRSGRSRRTSGRDQVRPSVQRLLDSMIGVAAFVRNARLDILSANQLGYALYAPAFLDPVRPVNLARFVFLDRHSIEFYADWNRIALDAVGSLRAEAARSPDDHDLMALIGELATRSEEFRTRGPATTSAPTAAGRSRSDTRSSGNSPSTTTRSSFRPTSGRRSSPTPPRRAHPQQMPSANSKTAAPNDMKARSTHVQK